MTIPNIYDLMHLQIHIIVYSTIVTFEWCLVIYFKTIMYCEENYPIIPIRK
jgi:hypothetical protein